MKNKEKLTSFEWCILRGIANEPKSKEAFLLVGDDWKWFQKIIKTIVKHEKEIKEIVVGE